ncbi:MAG TPA: antibiotic biosynthesis monooxygenase family protein [Stellaceae bacterium]|nr:antibiotic biosynthesis monooxygenase family protein [Stellaceae bacterium]
MILEIAQIDVKPGLEAEFEANVAKAAPLFARARGCKGMELQRSIEKPSRFRLFVTWESVEHHTVEFRGSADFQEWRKLVGHCFAAPPDVEHTSRVVKGF